MLAVVRLLVQKKQPNACCGQLTCTEETAECLLWSGYLYRSNSLLLAVVSLLVQK